MNARGFNLREAEAADLPLIEDLWVAAWLTTGIEVDFAARRPWLRERLSRLAAEGVEILVGLDSAGRPAGFVTIDPHSGYLDQLCVAPREQGRGLARILLARAKQRAPGGVDLQVNADNPRARRFYEREGFEIVGRGTSETSGLPILRMAWPKRRDSRAGQIH